MAGSARSTRMIQARVSYPDTIQGRVHVTTRTRRCGSCVGIPGGFRRRRVVAVCGIAPGRSALRIRATRQTPATPQGGSPESYPGTHTLGPEAHRRLFVKEAETVGPHSTQRRERFRKDEARRSQRGVGSVKRDAHREPRTHRRLRRSDSSADDLHFEHVRARSRGCLCPAASARTRAYEVSG